MKRITILNLVLAVAYVVFFMLLRISGYYMGVTFALPNILYLLMTPIIGVLFAFNATLILLYKPRKTMEIIFKWSSLILLIILSIATFTLPWTYVVFGTALQTFIQILMISMAIGLAIITIVTITKVKPH